MTLNTRLNWTLTEPRTPPVTPNAKDEEWNDGAGMSGPVKLLDASWIAFGNTQTRTYPNGRLVLGRVSPGSATHDVAGIGKVQPATPYTVTCEIAPDRHVATNIVSLGFRDTATGKMWLNSLFQEGVVSTDEFRRVGLVTERFANATTRTSTSVGILFALRTLWLRVANTGSLLVASWSPTGVEGTYETLVSENYATALMTPTDFCITVNPLSATNDALGEFGPVRVT